MSVMEEGGSKTRFSTLNGEGEQSSNDLFSFFSYSIQLLKGSSFSSAFMNNPKIQYS